jgi:flagellar biosynthetic protein FliR
MTPMPHGNQLEWTSFLSAMTLVLVRVSGMVAFAPFFSSTALPVRTKAVFVGAVAFLLAPLVAALPSAQVSINFSALLGELAVGLVYGLALTLLNEMLLFAGQIAGLQFSFSLVNLLDPASAIQTPLLGDLFQLMGTLVVIAAGLDRIILASMVRSFRVAPLGSYALAPVTALTIVRAAAGIFLAAVELAAPVLAATLLVEVAVALLGKLSPQLPVISLTVPLKTLTGFALLAGSLALWPRFIEARFAGLLDTLRACIPVWVWEDSRCPESAPNRPPSIAARRPARKAMCCTAASCRLRPEPWRG